jgi:multisubunit Na+/H+ antiporter MnhC subunit
MPIIHIGHHRVITLAGSDASIIPPGSIAAVSDSGVVSASIDPVTGHVTLTAAVAGMATVTFSAPGYIPTSEGYTVPPPPGILVTDGPEV